MSPDPTDVLPDLVRPGLKVVFCGTGVGAASARRGAYYAGSGNRFWTTLYEVGLTPRILAPAEFRELLKDGIGLTDLWKHESGADQGLSSNGFDIARLEGALRENRPGVIAFNGKKAAQMTFGHNVGYGWQTELVAGTEAMVLPSTSGAARGFWDIAPWYELAESVPR